MRSRSSILVLRLGEHERCTELGGPIQHRFDRLSSCGTRRPGPLLDDHQVLRPLPFKRIAPVADATPGQGARRPGAVLRP